MNSPTSRKVPIKPVFLTWMMLRWEPAPAVVYHLAGSSDLQNWQSSPVQPVEEAGLLKAVVDSWASLPYWRVEASRE